jgi:hypothetical protein
MSDSWPVLRAAGRPLIRRPIFVGLRLRRHLGSWVRHRGLFIVLRQSRDAACESGSCAAGPMFVASGHRGTCRHQFASARIHRGFFGTSVTVVISRLTTHDAQCARYASNTRAQVLDEPCQAQVGLGRRPRDGRLGARDFSRPARNGRNARGCVVSFSRGSVVPSCTCFSRCAPGAVCHGHW